MNILLIVYSVLILIWLMGVGAASYHVFKYRLPGDATVRMFWIFLAVSAIALLYVVFVLSGANWGGA
jgi:hypothetical protein